ncbi:MAG: flagellar biosynthetic protein FliO [Candidatus Adiutrix sp.]|jgi:flagellar biogenesis protein FliO|nr:flagellar biosynthetic protein FliO [Candidatus Adiutrix sp.]
MASNLDFFDRRRRPAPARFRLLTVAAAFALLLAASLASAQEAAPPASPAAVASEDLPEIAAAGSGPATPAASPGAETAGGFEAGRSVPGSALRPPWHMWDIFKSWGAFILVLVLLWLTLKGLGRLGRFRGQKSQDYVFSLRGVLALDKGKYLAAVEIDGRVLVIGVSPGGLAPLAQWPAARDEAAETPADPADFQDAFKLAGEDRDERRPPDISVVDQEPGR